MASSPIASYKFLLQPPTDAGAMRNEAKKLTLFSTGNMKPLFMTDDLDLIMAKLGFTSAVNHTPPPSAAPSAAAYGSDNTFLGWREYVFNSKWTRAKSVEEPPPMVMLPYPRIDGLHESIYAEFISSVEFYLRRNVTEILHVRGLPLDRILDKGKAWRPMEEGEIVVYVCRDVPVMEMKTQGGKKIGKASDVEREGKESSSRASGSGVEKGGDVVEACRFVDFNKIVKL